MRAMNQLKVHIQQAIMALHKQGWSGRKIARELDLDRATVGKYLRQESKPAIVPAGSDPPEGSKPAIVLTGSGEQPARQQRRQVVENPQDEPVNASRCGSRFRRWSRAVCRRNGFIRTW